MPIWLSTSRFAPSPDILRTRQSIPEPSNEIVPAFRMCWRWVPRFSSRPGMLSLPLNYFLESICSISQASNSRMVLCLATYPSMRGVAPRCIALNLTRLRGLFELLFFFQAEDGIRDADVTGVQTCALPICAVGQDDAVGIAAR